jgi:hypothetical protein
MEKRWFVLYAWDNTGVVKWIWCEKDAQKPTANDHVKIARGPYRWKWVATRQAVNIRRHVPYVSI